MIRCSEQRAGFMKGGGKGGWEVEGVRVQGAGLRFREHGQSWKAKGIGFRSRVGVEGAAGSGFREQDWGIERCGLGGITVT